MSLLSDLTIQQQCDPQACRDDPALQSFQGYPMIDPFVPQQVRRDERDNPIISYGLSSYGYDVRLSPVGVKLFTNIHSRIVDPMAPDEKCYADAEVLETIEGLKYFILPPSSYAMGATMEFFHMPYDVCALCLGKSTYARSAIGINATPVEAGFYGEVVIEITNQSVMPVRIYLESGIAQFQFFRGDRVCETSYADNGRKYQGQRGVTLPKV